jgi:DNA-binding CsgD family transcriptional regulator
MLHAELAVCIVSFSLGIAILLLSVLAYSRYGHVAFRHVTVLVAGSMLVLIADSVRIYGGIAVDKLGSWAPIFYCAASAVGFALVGSMIPSLCRQVSGIPLTTPRRVLHIAIGVVLGVLGGIRGLFAGTLAQVAVMVGMGGVQVYAACMVVPRLAEIANERVRSLMRSFFLLIAAMLVLGCAEIVAHLFVPGFGDALFGQTSIVEVLCFFTVACLIVVYSVRDLFKEEARSVPYALPVQFSTRYGISPREAQIVAMISQGYSNSKIGEELFISAITVKNHIYHIYQKTGVKNKVQLLNLINTPK